MSVKAKKARTVFHLSTPMRELLEKLNFETIPEEAKALVFWEDGEAQFFDEFPRGDATTYIPPVPHIKAVLVETFEDITIMIDE